MCQLSPAGWAIPCPWSTCFVRGMPHRPGLHTQASATLSRVPLCRLIVRADCSCPAMVPCAAYVHVSPARASVGITMAHHAPRRAQGLRQRGGRRCGGSCGSAASRAARWDASWASLSWAQALSTGPCPTLCSSTLRPSPRRATFRSPPTGVVILHAVVVWGQPLQPGWLAMGPTDGYTTSWPTFCALPMQDDYAYVKARSLFSFNSLPCGCF
jgi:hypothetical protein